MNFVNLTPHEITVYRLDGPEPLCSIRSSGSLRLEEKETRVVGTWLSAEKLTYLRWAPEENYCMFVPVVTRMLLAAPESLPAAKDKTVYILSLPALMGLRAAGCERPDLVAPDTGAGPYGAVRDSNGRVIGVRRFVYLPCGAQGEPFTATDNSEGYQQGAPVSEWEAATPAHWPASAQEAKSVPPPAQWGNDTGAAASDYLLRLGGPTGLEARNAAGPWRSVDPAAYASDLLDRIRSMSSAMWIRAAEPTALGADLKPLDPA